MELFSHTSIDDVKRKSLAEIVQNAGIDLKPSGPGRFVGICPFHDEKTPSFFVFETRGRFRCFGCQQGGDVIDFVRMLKGLSFKQACVELCGGASGSGFRWAAPDPEKERERRHAQAVHRWESMYLECLMKFCTVGRWYLRRHATRENWLSFSGLIEAMSEAERRMEILSMGTEEARTAFRRGLRAGAVVYAW